MLVPLKCHSSNQEMPSCLKDPRTLCLASTDTFRGALRQMVFLAPSVIRNTGRFSPHRKGNGSIGYRIHEHRDEYRSPAQTAQAQMVGGHVYPDIPYPYTLNTAEQRKLQSDTKSLWRASAGG
jgi:hypothetical protein